MIEARNHLAPDETGRCWRRAARRIRAVEPRRHRELAAYHVIAGQMRYLVDDRVCLAGPRTLLWVTSDHAHMLLSETPDFDMWIFVFSDELKPKGKALPELVSRLPVESHDELCRIAEVCERSADELVRLKGISWWGERALEAALAGESSDLAYCRPVVKRAAELIAADPSLENDELAIRLGLGAPRIARLFREDTGDGLCDYRNRCRLAEVDRLLASSRGANLLSCAMDAGFGSYSQFFRVFQTMRGQSPREWYRLLDTKSEHG